MTGTTHAMEMERLAGERAALALQIIALRERARTRLLDHHLDRQQQFALSQLDLACQLFLNAFTNSIRLGPF